MLALLESSIEPPLTYMKIIDDIREKMKNNNETLDYSEEIIDSYHERKEKARL